MEALPEGEGEDSSLPTGTSRPGGRSGTAREVPGTGSQGEQVGVGCRCQGERVRRAAHFYSAPGPPVAHRKQSNLDGLLNTGGSGSRKATNKGSLEEFSLLINMFPILRRNSQLKGHI